MWFDDAVCDFCGERAAAFVVITAAHAEHEWFYAVGVVNLCNREDCITSCENHVQLRISASKVRGFNFIWHNEDGDSARFNAMTWREPFSWYDPE